jgi:glycosyltransferase involved in cell wall biosynthesis
MAIKNSLSVILPVYNEAANLGSALKDISDYTEKLTDDFEIIAVNDGSTDQSRQILAAWAAADTRIRLVNSEKNNGYGWALRQGINAAAKDWLLIFDVDRQFEISDLGQMWAEKHKVDFILGWRRKRKDGIYRAILGRLGNFLTNLILWPYFSFIKDVNCGFKLFKTEVLKPFCLTSTGGTINFEILYLLKSSNLAFIQLPISHYPRKTGSQTGGNLGTVIKIFRESLRILFAYAQPRS